MNQEIPRRAKVSIVAAFVWLALATVAEATVVSYTIDPAHSSLTLTGDVEGTPLTPQGAGADFDTYQGMIVGDLVAGVLTFSGGSSIVADLNGSGPFLPAAGGTVDNYGMETATYVTGLGLPPGPLAFRDVVFDITAGSLSDGALPSLVDIPVTGTAASPYLGAYPLAGSGIWHSIGMASLTTTAGVETLILPFQRESGVGELHVFLTGTLVATRTVPEPANLVLVGMGLVTLLLIASRRRAALIQHRSHDKHFMRDTSICRGSLGP